ncbi:MAG: histidine kinase [Deltaproteobacteria bacterium]|nr:histidine kinase [Deltaproteobacteria bacterium]
MLRTIGLAAAMGLVMAVIFAANGGNFVASWLIATMYGTTIGVPAKLLLPRLKRQLGGMRELGQWFVYIAVMLAIIAVASAVTGLAMVALGFARLSQFWGNYEFGALVSLTIAIPASFGASTYARLAERTHASERIANEAQLASLESRVRPHFLFNALNSAIALIPEDPARAEDVLERLAALLRFSLDRQQARLVPLAEELRIVVDYLEIERARFGERLRYRVDVAKELEACEVPAFALQTLVENSVKYAIATRTEGGEIAIAARARGGTLELEVTDDGPGFAANATLAPGHGLDTLRARLAALYGGAATLTAPAPTTAGARVLVEVPRR